MGVRGPVWGRTGWENGGRHSNWTPEEEVKIRREERNGEMRMPLKVGG